MSEKLKKRLEKVTFTQYVVGFVIAALLRTIFLPVIQIRYPYDNLASEFSFALVALIILQYLLTLGKPGPFKRRLLGIGSLLAAVVFAGSRFPLFYVFLALGFSLLREPEVAGERGFGWKLEFPLALILLPNIWWGSGWLVLGVVAILVLQEIFAEQLKDFFTGK